MSRFEAPPGIITNGLVLNLDAGDPDSYTRSQPPYVEVLVVAGGGGGGGWYYAGGGGAGGVIYNSAYQLTSAAAVTVTVGAGGAQQTGNSQPGNDGSTSSFGGLSTVGGGGGGGGYATGPAGRNGGSGGGGGRGSSYSGGLGISGQGNNGGNYNGWAGGGGGAGEAGATGANNANPGNGGDGLPYSITGFSTYYGGGGGGAVDANIDMPETVIPQGGLGGGGNGATYTNLNTAAGTGVTNTGGGGGGGCHAGANPTGAAGGSGIVIVRYPGLPAATGGTITYLNGYTIHTFTTSGTFTPYLWNDVSGNGNNGTLVNGVGFNSFQNGGSLIFDGTDDKVSTSFGPTSGDFTICLWFKDNGSGAYGRIADKDYVNGFFLGRNGGSANSWGGGILEASPPYGIFLTLEDGKWHFLTSIRSGTTHILYGDGIANTTSNTVSSTALSSTTLALGDWSSGNIQPFTGNIACCFYYSRALSSTEVLQNFNATRARFGL